MPVTVRTFASLGEAASTLGSEREARFFGGGTLLMRALNEGNPAFATIVRTTDPRLKEIRAAGPRIALGAGVTMAEILKSRELEFLHPVARTVGGPAVRSAATVGGNLFAETPYGDLTVALLALDATVSVHGGYSAREMPLAELLAQRERGAQGVVEQVTIERPAPQDAFRFLKVSRVRPKGISVLSIAAHLPTSGGRIQGARIAYGAMAPTPIRAPAVERALEGRSLDQSGIAQALAVAADDCAPADDAIASAWYRREVLPIHLRRLLLGEAR
jgi:CO/xanthine dehydrogenase FAD-binding subunit